ncbi:MAG: hypothetical protein AAF705_12565 [Bacteroidota bacterium]
MRKMLYAFLCLSFVYYNIGLTQDDSQLKAESLAKVKTHSQALSDDFINQILQAKISYEQSYKSMPQTNISTNNFIVFGIHDLNSYTFLKEELAASQIQTFWDASINQIEGIEQNPTTLPSLLLEKEAANATEYITQAKNRKQQISAQIKKQEPFILCTNIIHSAEQLDEMGGSSIGLFIDEIAKIYQKNTLNVAILAPDHALQKELAELKTTDQKIIIDALGLRIYSYNQSFRKGLSSQLRAYINLFDALILL